MRSRNVPSPELGQFIWKQIRQMVLEVKPLLQKGVDIDADWFELFDSVRGSPGYRMRRGSLLALRISGPKEAGGEALLDFSSTWNPITKMRDHYRYEVWWKYAPDLHLNDREDYFEMVMVGLKRSIRFDFHPDRSEDDHDGYHWHPYCVGEVALPTPEMTPRMAVLFALRCFSRKTFDEHAAGEYKSDCELIEKSFFAPR
jgi:hypothetical protein